MNSTDTRVSRDCGCEGTRGGDITVNNRNNATVGNTVGVGANTGENTALGGNGGDGGNGGEATGGHSHHWYHHSSSSSNDGGNGGDGGDGGTGGEVSTGDAFAGASVTNVVNTTITRVR